MNDRPRRGDAASTADAAVACVTCGYSLAGDPVRCSECGLERSREVRTVELVRAGAMASAPRGRLTLALVSFAVVVVYGAGVTMMNAGGVMLGVAAAVSMAIALGGSLAVGWVVGRLAGPVHAPFVVDAWRRTLPVMHAPWLVAPFLAAVALAAAYFDVRTAGSASPLGAASTVVALLGVPLWGGGCLIAGGLAISRLLDRLRDYGVASTSARRAAVTATLVVMVGSAALGLAGGAYAAIRTPQLLGVDVFGLFGP